MSSINRITASDILLWLAGDGLVKYLMRLIRFGCENVRSGRSPFSVLALRSSDAASHVASAPTFGCFIVDIQSKVL